MSLSDYLTKNYLSDNKKKPKKSKKEKKENHSNIIIESTQPLIKDEPTFEEPTQLILEDKKQIKRNKGWKVVGTDEIVPEVERDEEVINNDGQRMSSGAKSGLQTAEEVAKQIKEKEEADLWCLENNSSQHLGKNAQTVYRDASGRKIDMEKRREEARTRQIEEEERKRLEHKKRNMGLVQLLDLEEHREQLKKAGGSNLARYADDQELNSRLKSKEHDDDPLLSFKPSKSKKYVSRTGRKLFKDGFPENRFGIVPGWRWDGVDRSNGFEKSWFKRQAEMAEKKTLSYTMQEDY